MTHDMRVFRDVGWGW